jgi:beta-glucosidase
MLNPHLPRKEAFWNPDLPIPERVEYLLSLLTLEEKIKFLYHVADDIPRLNIRHYYHGNEALHGVVRPGKATVFPQAIAFGATWNPALIEQVSTAISDEARAKHHHEPEGPGHSNGLLTFWSPTVNMARDPRWGRTAETYGEDPFLTGRIGVAFVKGLQGNDPRYLKIVSTPKHYAGNNEDHNRNRCKPNISMKNLREYFLPQFEALIREGKAESIMSAYNAIFNIPCSYSHFLLTEVLRDEWKFGGYIVTDCSAIENGMPWNHRYVWTYPDACAGAINAGIDLECGHLYKKGYLLQAYRKGKVTEATIDRATRNVLRAYMKLGWFDPAENVPFSQIPLSVVGCDKHSKLALEVARQSMVLLKNIPSPISSPNNLLPLDPSKKHSIAVIGPNAGVCQFGDYSGTPKNPPVSPVEGLRKRFGVENVQLVPWIAPRDSKRFHPIPAANLRPSTDCAKYIGLKRTIFAQPDFHGATITQVDTQIHFTWKGIIPDQAVSNAFAEDPTDPALNTPGKRFSLRWEGVICPEISGEYRLRIRSRGPQKAKIAKLYWGNPLQLINAKEITVNMAAGKEYPIRIDFAEVASPANLAFEWKMPPSFVQNPFEREIKAAKNAAIVIACLGLGTFYEREGHDKKNLDLPVEQEQLMHEIMAVNPNTVVVMISGSPLAFNWLEDNVPAILQAWYPGERGGDAIAEILAGDVNPSGKLPLTFYRSTRQLLPFNEYDIEKGMTYWYFTQQPLYPFGFGLSYTQFDYSAIQMEERIVNVADMLHVKVTVTNIGNRSGDEIVQAYIRYTKASGCHRAEEPLPKMQLKGFQRVSLKPNENKTIVLEIPIKSLEFFDVATGHYAVLQGDADLLVGKSSAEICAVLPFKIEKSYFRKPTDERI